MVLTKEQVLDFLNFYNSVNIRKYGQYQTPQMDGSHIEHNRKIDEKILDDFIERISEKEVIKLMTQKSKENIGKIISKYENND